jgi:hypothetical protein
MSAVSIQIEDNTNSLNIQHTGANQYTLTAINTDNDMGTVILKVETKEILRFLEQLAFYLGVKVEV